MIREKKAVVDLTKEFLAWCALPEEEKRRRLLIAERAAWIRKWQDEKIREMGSRDPSSSPP